jgi:molybdate transport system substrate-binding protein
VRTSRLLAFALPLALVVGLAACGDDDTTSTSVSSTTQANRIPGDLTVFAAASLTEAFTDAQVVLEDENPGLELTFSFAGSGALVTQVQAGAPADLIATADRASMQTLADIGVVGEPVVFARNRLAILVAPGNPKGIEELADLADPELKVVLADESVPAGRYAAEALGKAGVEVSPVSKELDVKSTAAKVTSGEADAAIVYATDVTAAGDKGEGVEIPEEHNVVVEYPVAIVQSTGNIPGAEAYLEDLVSGEGQKALRARGFLAPS